MLDTVQHQRMSACELFILQSCKVQKWDRSFHGCRAHRNNRKSIDSIARSIRSVRPATAFVITRSIRSIRPQALCHCKPWQGMASRGKPYPAFSVPAGAFWEQKKEHFQPSAFPQGPFRNRKRAFPAFSVPAGAFLEQKKSLSSPQRSRRGLFGAEKEPFHQSGFPLGPFCSRKRAFPARMACHRSS